MIPLWTALDSNGRATFMATVAFLKTRLGESSTIEWALRLGPDQNIERIAVADLLKRPTELDLEEPWASAWRLIEESWSQSPVEESPSTGIYAIRNRLRAGDRSGVIVSAIANLVAPRLEVMPLASWRWTLVKKPRRPKTVGHLLSARLTSGELVDLRMLELERATEVPFLISIAVSLEAVVNHGLGIARRIGWDGDLRLGRLGGLHRVSYTQVAGTVDGKSEPDAYHRGIAPSVKLLHAVVMRIVELQPESALPFVRRWRFDGSQVHDRLWAALARNPFLVSAEEVGEFLIGRDNRQFWDLHVFPEIAELRALRFAELGSETQRAVAARLRKLPPRSFWVRNADAQQVKNNRLYWAARELKRVELAGGELPTSAQSWLEAKIGQFVDLGTMTKDNGFPEAPMVSAVFPSPDDRYDTLQGAVRLRTMEKALSSDRGGWYDKAERANDWLQQPDNAVLVLGDLEGVEHGADDFPRVWNRFGWAHSPGEPAVESGSTRNLQLEAERVLRLLTSLADTTWSAGIEGISHWLHSWRKQVIASPSGLPMWFRAWPMAVEATNARREVEEDAELTVSAQIADDDQQPKELDTLNTPSGKLVGVFLSACPSLSRVPQPFVAGSRTSQMRDAVISSDGVSGLIARHQLVESLAYFLRADQQWTQEHLIAPMHKDDDSSLILWQAIAKQRHFTDVLKIIGDTMAKKAADQRLGRETRQRLVFSLVVESLHAFREARDPAVANSRIQQMLRTINDETRVAAANGIRQFVRELAKNDREDEPPPSRATLFRTAAAPFLQRVWPQERSLTTPSVSAALARLPATSKEAFAEAVEVIERFLMPFDCWSMLDYGLYGNDDEGRKLSKIDDEAKARAFLRLLDLTVGTSENAAIPDDLADALKQIQSVAPALVKLPAFRRLSAAARR